MKNKLEVIFDTTPSGGCGCNCGCGGSSKVDEMNEIINELKSYQFKQETKVDVLDVSDIEKVALIEKLNNLLENTNAQFRANLENVDEIANEILPIVVFNDSIITAYGTPTLYDIVLHVEKSL